MKCVRYAKGMESEVEEAKRGTVRQDAKIGKGNIDARNKRNYPGEDPRRGNIDADEVPTHKRIKPEL